jgi:Flp pilus assembly protein TadB
MSLRNQLSSTVSPDEPDSAANAASADPLDELRRLLELAETIQDRYEFLQRRLYVVRAAQLGLVAAAAVVAIATNVRVYAAAIGGAALYAALVEVLLRRNLERRVARERRALAEVVELVREVEGASSLANRWSALERAEFRIRLSRFDA